jgi:CheY-like chemotaxis protein
MRKRKPILIIDDDKVDVMTTERALKELNVTNPVYIAWNGEEALSILKDENLDLPGIILLDLNMPRMNGIDFLRIMKKDERIRRIPVVVLTTSREEEDKVESFNLGVAGYMVKPVDYIKFVDVIKAINLYWTLSELSDL